MPPRLALALAVSLLLSARTAMSQTDVSAHARQVLAAAILVDGHNDLVWELRRKGDWGFTRIDLAKRLDKGQTDIPRRRARRAPE